MRRRKRSAGWDRHVLGFGGVLWLVANVNALSSEGENYFYIMTIIPTWNTDILFNKSLFQKEREKERREEEKEERERENKTEKIRATDKQK